MTTNIEITNKKTQEIQYIYDVEVFDEKMKPYFLVFKKYKRGIVQGQHAYSFKKTDYFYKEI